MKGLHQCFGVFFLFFIMLGLSLSVSSTVSAYQYDLEYIPFVHYASGNNNGFQLYEPLMFEADDSFRMLSSNWYTFNSTFSDGSCVYSNHRTLDSFSSFSNISSFSILATLKPTDDSWSGSFSDYEKCMFEEPFPSFKSTSFPLIQFESLSSYLPYRFPFNAAYLKSSYSENGFDVQTKFDFSDLFYSDGISKIPNVHFTKIDIPLGISNLHFSAGDHVEVKGRFFLDSDDVNNVFTLDPNSTLTLQTTLLRDFNTYRSAPAASNSPTSVSCTMSSYLNPNEGEARYIWEYSCPFDMTAETNLSGYTLQFRGPSHGSPSFDPIFTYDDIFLWIYESSTVVTNYDTSSDPSGSKFQYFEFLGNKEHYAPGYAGKVPEDIIQNGVNYSSSLTNLFNFSLLNPFSGLFGLFSDSNSCASIPTLAGLIHSNETQVCPWFPSDVRSILTPVIGISSMMLVFGFVVRWLGSSSGNFFDDSLVDGDRFRFKSRGVLKS